MNAAPSTKVVNGKIKPMTNKDYEMMGWNAKEAGKLESDCPYYASSIAEKYWLRGFRG